MTSYASTSAGTTANSGSRRMFRRDRSRPSHSPECSSSNNSRHPCSSVSRPGVLVGREGLRILTSTCVDVEIFNVDVNDKIYCLGPILCFKVLTCDVRLLTHYARPRVWLCLATLCLDDRGVGVLRRWVIVDSRTQATSNEELLFSGRPEDRKKVLSRRIGSLLPGRDKVAADLVVVTLAEAFLSLFTSI
ncbi:hypothetical protein Taro_000207, partial [Colocasia esculenta]|nr:hypothetical protein [Colocasia esculenta]